MIEQNKKWYKRWWAILLFIFLTLFLIFLIAFGFYIAEIYKSINNNEVSGSTLVQALKKQKQYTNIEGLNNYWIGSSNPKLTIVEFGDFNCPLCANSYKKIRDISINYEKDVKIIYRDFPVRESSIELATAGRCAGEQGLFWPMYDKLFQNQSQFNSEKPNQVIEMAKQIGVDTNKFTECLASNKFLNNIKKDFTDGEIAEVTGTPTWFIDGYKIPGDIPYDIFIQLIDAMLTDK